MYKPGQIITVANVGLFRIAKADRRPHCALCSFGRLRIPTICSKYCYSRFGNNDFDKYPNGYVLKLFKPI